MHDSAIPFRKQSWWRTNRAMIVSVRYTNNHDERKKKDRFLSLSFLPYFTVSRHFSARCKSILQFHRRWILFAWKYPRDSRLHPSKRGFPPPSLSPVRSSNKFFSLRSIYKAWKENHCAQHRSHLSRTIFARPDDIAPLSGWGSVGR